MLSVSMMNRRTCERVMSIALASFAAPAFVSSTEIAEDPIEHPEGLDLPGEDLTPFRAVAIAMYAGRTFDSERTRRTGRGSWLPEPPMASSRSALLLCSR
jgi:hypothetical protein